MERRIQNFTEFLLIIKIPHLQKQNYTILPESNLDYIFKNIIDSILEINENITENSEGTKWILDQLIFLESI